MVDWSNNTKRFCELENLDPVLWSFMKMCVSALIHKNGRYYYIDDNHEDNECYLEPLDYILINQNYKVIPNAMSSEYPPRRAQDINKLLSDNENNSWISPAFIMDEDCSGQCKNALYILEGKVHLSTRAYGMDIVGRDSSNLRKGEFLIKHWHYSDTFCGMHSCFVIPIMIAIERMKSGN
jgi:hypothetical protein